MSEGIRVEVEIEPRACPVARSTNGTDAVGHSVSRTAVSDDGVVTEEFVVDVEDGSLDGSELPDGTSKMFSYGENDVYRFDRPRNDDCPCDFIEEFDCPVVNVTSRHGRLLVTFHTESVEDVREVLGALQEEYPGTEVRRLINSDGEDRSEEMVMIDRGELTTRQEEVLRTAYEMGYFDHPKGANASEVADALGIVTSTFSEHISVAQNKILSSVVSE